MQVTARVDYAIRAVVELAAHPDQALSRNELATAQGMPGKFLESILRDLTREGLLASQRGSGGGFRLNRPPEQIPLADIVRAVDGPLAAVRGSAPEGIAYTGSATALTKVWVAVRASLRQVLEATTVAHIVAGEFPAPVQQLIADEQAWHRR